MGLFYKQLEISYRVTHIKFYLVFLILAFSLIGCGQQAEQGLQNGEAKQKIIVIKFPHVTAPSTPKGQVAERFKKLSESRLPGRISVEVYPSGQLMTDDDSLDALAFGEIQMIAVSLSKFDRLTKKYQVFDLPFLFPDIAAVEKFQASPVGLALLSEIKDKGFQGLAYWHNGMKQFGAPRPLRSPEDAAGLKFRIMESDLIQSQILQIQGIPQKMSFVEVYQALQTGAIDAQENTWSNQYSEKFYEVQPYITETNHGYLGYLVAVNPRFWSSLPDDVRSVLEKTMIEVTEWGNSLASVINEEDRLKISQSSHTEIVKLTDDERKHWIAAMRPVWDQFKDEIGEEMIKSAMDSASPVTP